MAKLKYYIRNPKCPLADEHSPEPNLEGYEFMEWFRGQEKTHRLLMCEGCGLYLIWIPTADIEDGIYEGKQISRLLATDDEIFHP